MGKISTKRPHIYAAFLLVNIGEADLHALSLRSEYPEAAR